MSNYETEMNTKIEKGDALPEKLDYSVLRYFWEVSPFTSKKSASIPRFLRKIEVLKNFSENELRLLSRFMHLRNFADHECIFKQGKIGIGFYFIFSGHVDIIVERDQVEPNPIDDNEEQYVISLDKYDYFGELALLQEKSVRNATAIAKDNCSLLGIFKPDIENLIEDHPIVATKLLQSVSRIVANRLFTLTKEVRKLKHKIVLLESENGRLRAED